MNDCLEIANSKKESKEMIKKLQLTTKAKRCGQNSYVKNIIKLYNITQESASQILFQCDIKDDNAVKCSLSKFRARMTCDYKKNRFGYFSNDECTILEISLHKKTGDCNIVIPRIY